MEPTRTLYTTTTTVHVGPEDSPQTFHVHTPFLTSNSAYFAAALSKTSGFVEASINSVTLIDADPRIFAFFVQWLYTKSLAHEQIDWEKPVGSESGVSTDGEDSSRAPSSRGASPATGKNDIKPIGQALDLTSLSLTSTPDQKSKSKKEKRQPPAFFYLIRLYKLADYLGCELLRNNIIDEVARVARARNTVPCPDDTWELMEEGMGGKSMGGKINGLRGLAIDLFVGKKTANLIRTSEGWSDEFLKEVVLKQKEREENMVPGVPMVEPYKDKKMRCLSYHEHKDTKKCVKWIGDV
ncbi:hypothetical protein MMC30_008674 [Trapelia coarctata]|nr:hypothetical protein [Trapelia coarctata]